MRPLVVVAALAVVAFAWWMAGRGRVQVQAPGGILLSPDAAYDSALALSNADRLVESFPYYRRALEGTAARAWRVHFNYGAALYDRTLEFSMRGHAQVTATRSSVERVALMREALAQMIAAGKLAPDPATSASILKTQANMLYVWGFPWEAFTAFRQAQYADPSNKANAGRADQFMELLRSPTMKTVVGPDSLPVLTTGS